VVIDNRKNQAGAHHVRDRPKNMPIREWMESIIEPYGQAWRIRYIGADNDLHTWTFGDRDLALRWLDRLFPEESHDEAGQHRADV
jgi:hypothetical protein